MTGTTEFIFLGTSPKVGQAIIVTSFQQEMTGFRTKFHTKSSQKTIIKLVFHPLSILLVHPIRTIRRIPIITHLFLFIQKECHLRTHIDKELCSLIQCILTESQMSQQRNLYIIHGTAISIFCSVINILIPTALGIINFRLNSAHHIKVLLTHIAGSNPKCHSI